MAPRKLSEADKRDVIEIYRQPGETTSTIAKRYGVSTSTISRILKTQLPEEEYRALISQKRSSTAEKPSVPAPTPKTEEKPASAKPVRRVRKRSRSAEVDSQAEAEDMGQLELLAAEEETDIAAPVPAATSDDVPAVTRELLEQPRLRRKNTDNSEDELEDDVEIDDLDEDLDDLDDDLDSELDAEFDDDEEDDDEDDGDEEDGEDEPGLLGQAVEIMPISDAVFPRTCYLVVDRLSELITHPLNEFAELGNIPAEQESALTLPIFENHRVARRFSRRNQRVIKVPDGQLITKATSYLQAKGITHLLIDGNIYSLLG
ncbi:transposase [Leptolyngbya sp. Heron Island J]|uniref:helix-turn-helix domain-containing protein n=1 Tax=Leptolyngbya sp. Heron Island J TaxID=1385935 RepID=UPI0003B944DA|nr:helix-turn-helix domain-containing protein [Leptolyngbya sp. Heron Island J]ESA36297.1 transposase [Leptolyngbya sp. Heron Island J]